MEPIERIREEGRKALESLLEDYSGEELLNPEQTLDQWQVAELRESCRKALLAWEMSVSDDNRCSECNSLITSKDSPFCCECGAKNANFDPELFPNMAARIGEECAQGHPSSQLVEEEELAPIDFYCYLCGSKLESASTTVPDPPV